MDEITITSTKITGNKIRTILNQKRNGAETLKTDTENKGTEGNGITENAEYRTAQAHKTVKSSPEIRRCQRFTDTRKTSTKTSPATTYGNY
jgi:hypothetical protein